MYILLPIVTFLLISLASYFIGFRVHNSLQKKDFKWPKLVGFLSFLLSFAVIFVIVAYIVLRNVRFER